MARAMCLIIVTGLAAVSFDLCHAREHPMGNRQYPLDSLRCVELFALLDNDNNDSLIGIPDMFFKPGYDKNLVDLVVYFKKNGTETHNIKAALVQNGKIVEDLWDARYVWIMVFTDDPSLLEHEFESTTTIDSTTLRPADKGTITKTVQETVQKFQRTRVNDSTSVEEKFDSTTTITRTTEKPTDEEFSKKTVQKLTAITPSVRSEALEYRRGIGELSVIAAIVSLFADVKPTADKEKELEDQDAKLSMQLIGTSDKALYFGMAKISVRENTIYRVRAALKDSRAYATFGNYSPSRVRASFGLAFTLVDGKHREQGVSSKEVEPYILFNFYLLSRPKLPRSDRTRLVHLGWPSAVVGFKVSDSPFDDLIVGGALNHMVGSFGLFAGVRYSKRKVPTNKSDWDWAYTLGLNYTL
ncbi:MAG: hypothetical protein V3V49_01485 [Candidatus Krumholzibacteria bacterium]